MARPLRIEYPGAFYHVMNRGLSRSQRGGQNEARLVAIYLSRQLGGHTHGEIGQAVGLKNPSSVSSAHLRMKWRVANEHRFSRRVQKIEESMTKS